MKEARLYEAKVSCVPVYAGQEIIERCAVNNPPYEFVANSDEAIPRQFVETVRLPIERFRINGSDVLVAFDHELQQLLSISEETTQAKLANAAGWQTRSAKLSKELDNYRTFWRRLRNLFRKPRSF